MIGVISDAADSMMLMRSLVLEVLFEASARGAVLAHMDMNGQLIVVGSYGYASDDLSATARVSIWTHNPLTDAVCTGEPLIFDSHRDLGERYPGLHGMTSAGVITMVLPVRDRGLTVGALAISFSAPGGLDPDASVWSSITELLGWHLRQYSPVRGVPDEPVLNPRLTTRQVQMLELMAEGCTNSQIATRLGYSAATIRADALHVYRQLQVHSRHDAVLAARRSGVLGQAPPE